MSTTEPAPLQQAPRSTHGATGPGAIIDSRYEVLRPIARGNATEIVEARHAHTGRAVVVKLLRREDRQTTEIIRRISREARALGAIQHPGVIAVFDAGMCRNHGPYVVLEKIDGRPLDGLLTARGSLGSEGAATILRALATAVAEVHRQGYVHRNIKPGNVFVSNKRIGGEVVQLLDFGVVGDLTPIAGKVLTPIGDVAAAPDFLAPEQLADPCMADARSDVYSIGAVIAACVGVSAESLFKARREHRRARSALVDAGLAAPLVDLVDRMLSLSIAERPPNAAAVVDALGDAGSSPVALLRYVSDADRPTVPDAKRAQPAEARRRHLRAPYITPVRILGTQEPIDGRSEDISSSGMLIGVRGIVRLDDKVTIRFALPTSGRVIAVEASPKWRREQGGRTALGLEFLGMDPQASAAIESYARFVAVER